MYIFIPLDAPETTVNLVVKKITFKVSKMLRSPYNVSHHQKIIYMYERYINRDINKAYWCCPCSGHSQRRPPCRPSCQCNRRCGGPRTTQDHWRCRPGQNVWPQCGWGTGYTETPAFSPALQDEPLSPWCLKTERYIRVFQHGRTMFYASSEDYPILRFKIAETTRFCQHEKNRTEKKRRALLYKP